jgi:hypothetical protein
MPIFLDTVNGYPVISLAAPGARGEDAGVATQSLPETCR